MKHVTAIMLALCLSVSAWAGSSLARQLPSDTLAYITIDSGAMLDMMDKAFALIDADGAATMNAQFEEVMSVLKELAQKEEIDEALIEPLLRAKLHLVVLRNPEVESFRAAAETGAWPVIPSLLIETNDDIAAGLLTQFRKIAQREHEEAGEEGDPYQELTVDAGQMISIPMDSPEEPPLTVGVLGSHLVLSAGEPKTLWQTLQSPIDTGLAADAIMQRVDTISGVPMIKAFVNLPALHSEIDAAVTGQVEIMRAMAEQATAQNPDQAQQIQGALMMAEMSLETWKNMAALFSLDTIGSLAMVYTVEPGENNIHVRQLTALRVPEVLGEGLRILLDSGESFRIPPIPERDTAMILWRMDPHALYNAIMQNLPQQIAGIAMFSLMSMKAEIGFDVNDILSQFAGDHYFSLDMVKREMEIPEVNEQTGEMEMIMKNMIAPKLQVLFGLKDAEATRTMLTSLFGTLSAKPGVGQNLKKTTYQETDVYLIGDGVGKENATADGLTSFAMTVLDGYLALGSMDEVTALIRGATQEPDANDPLPNTIETNSKANMLVCIPRAFTENIATLQKEKGEDMYALLMEELEKADLEMEDEELEQRLIEAMRTILKHYFDISAKAQSFSPAWLINKGELTGNNTYEVSSENVMQK